MQKVNKQAAQKLTDVKLHNGLSIHVYILMSEKLFVGFFTKRPDYDVKADVFVQEQKREVVHVFKYLGLLLDSQLSFKKQVVNIAKFNSANFRFIRNSLTN